MLNPINPTSRSVERKNRGHADRGWSRCLGGAVFRLVTVVASTILAGLTLAEHAGAGDAASRPNFVIVLVDDLRWDELSCTGHPVVRTTHIDRLAYQGARFRNAFATTPLCSPSRASFLTGQYPHHHGIVDNTNRSRQSHRLRTFPRLLQQAGYETAFVGKWHMGNDDTPRPGFDFWAGLKGQGTSFDPVVNINGHRKKMAGHTTDALTDLALSFLRRPRQKPFCLYLSHKALHPELIQYDDGSLSDPSAARFLPAKRHAKLYADAGVPRRLNVLDPLEGKPALRRKIDGLPPLGPETGTPDETVRDRWRMLAGVDESTGRLLAALERTGQLERTVVVLTSDHGYWYGEHGLSVERRLAYEEGIRIPLLVRYPPLIRSARLIDEMALSIDLAPTVLELAGIEPPAWMDGRSLVPLLRGKHPSNWRTAFLIEYYTDTVFPRVFRMGYQAIRTQRHKFIHYTELEDMDELYDLVADPYEMRNLVDEPSHQRILKTLQTRLERLRGE